MQKKMKRVWRTLEQLSWLPGDGQLGGGSSPSPQVHDGVAGEEEEQEEGTGNRREG
jgi:hypothetical protein